MITEAELDSYIERVDKEELGSLEAIADPELLGQFRRHLRQALIRLNGLEASDPFWEKTNRRPTIYKVHEWSSRRILDFPGDLDARWALFSLTVSGGQYEYAKVVTLIVRSDLTAIRWLINAAELISNMCGPDQAGALRSVLPALMPNLSLNSDAQNRSILQGVRSREVDILIDVLAGSTLQEASRRVDAVKLVRSQV
jgi:hypothetical protein